MKGILFKPELIKAIVEGRKTVTRRAIRPQPKPYLGYMDIGNNQAIQCGADYPDTDKDVVTARYKAGEVVYIKEAWQIYQWFNDTGTVQLQYKVNGNPDDAIREIVVSKYWEPNYLMLDSFRSPLFMPEWAARYFLTITDVRAERTRDITPSDCIAEGIAKNYFDTIGEHSKSIDRLIAEYFALYDSINGKGSHEKNWDWRYEFEVKK